jgi:hypothetical protein
MTAQSTDKSPGVANPQAELDRLRAENARLADEIAGKGTAAARRNRNLGAGALIVIGALLAALAIPAIWTNRTLMDTDTWVATVAPLASEPVIQDAVAAQVSDAVIQSVNVDSLLQQYLPQQLAPLSAPIKGAVENFIRDQSTKFTRSSAFTTVWVEANRRGHAALIAVITQREGGAITNKNGTVAIQLGVVAEQVQQRLVAQGLGFAAKIPTSSLNREIVLFSSPALAQAGRAVDLLQAMAFWIPVLALLAFAAAVALAIDRRRAVLWIGIGTLVATILPLQGIYLGKVPVINAAMKLGTSQGAAAGVAYDIIFRNLYSAEKTLAFLSLLLVVGAVLAGPAGFAVALRNGLKGGLGTMSSHFDFGPFGTFVNRYKRALEGVGMGLAVVISLLSPIHSVGFISWVAVILVLWLLAVEFFASGTDVEGDPAESTGDDAAAAI